MLANILVLSKDYRRGYCGIIEIPKITKVKKAVSSTLSFLDSIKETKFSSFGMRGSKKPKIIFWRAGPLYYRLPPLGEGSRNPSVSAHQLVLL